jgi:hypothetical protein
MDKTSYLAIVSNLTAGRHILQTPDQSGNGYDIACANHDTSLFGHIKAIVAAKGGTVCTLSANGYPCAWIVTIPDAATEQLRLCQHPGAWGPWYHVSRYVLNPLSGKYRFAEELYNVGNHKAAVATGLAFGRP